MENSLSFFIDHHKNLVLWLASLTCAVIYVQTFIVALCLIPVQLKAAAKHEIFNTILVIILSPCYIFSQIDLALLSVQDFPDFPRELILKISEIMIGIVVFRCVSFRRSAYKKSGAPGCWQIFSAMLWGSSEPYYQGDKPWTDRRKQARM